MINEFSRKESPLQGLTGLGGGIAGRLLSGVSGITVDQVFSTKLYTGNGSTQTITNDIDLSGEGGLIWTKCRSAAQYHRLVDTARGVNRDLITNGTFSEQNQDSSNSVSAFNSNGYNLGPDGAVNTSSEDYVSWTFRKTEKFFDVVTYTGDGTTNRNIPHNLGSVPGFIVVKGLNFGSDPWYSYHRYAGNTTEFRLSETDYGVTGSSRWASYTPTSSHFRGDTAAINVNGRNYVAYLFAHDEQEFGAGSDEAIIKCGGFSMGSNTTISHTLGFQPQWMILKRYNTNAGSNWWLFDTTRGWTSSQFKWLYANTAIAEETKNYTGIYPTSTGFTFDNSNNGQWSAGGDFIYVAISDGS